MLERSPTLLRLKELEALEKVTERIDKLTVYGGLDGVLHQLVKLLRRSVPSVPGMRHNGMGTELLSQLHRVLDRRQCARPRLRIVLSQYCEIRSMDRHDHSPLRGRLSELGATLLLPREPVHERQLDRVVAQLEKRIEEFGILHPLGGEPRDAVADHAAYTPMAGGVLRVPCRSQMSTPAYFSRKAYG